MASGFDLGCPSDQVTVAKQRTMFQAHTSKCGEVDVSCKDYMLSWGTQYERGNTSYTPDMHSDFGAERGTEKTVRLPTTTWPFDHAGIAVCFDRPKMGLLSSLQVREKSSRWVSSE